MSTNGETKSWVEAVVIEIRKDPRQTGNIGKFRFQTCPRVGDVIAINDAQGVGQAYKVIQVEHKAEEGDNVPNVIGDLRVIWLGVANGWVADFCREASSQATR